MPKLWIRFSLGIIHQELPLILAAPLAEFSVLSSNVGISSFLLFVAVRSFSILFLPFCFRSPESQFVCAFRRFIMSQASNKGWNLWFVCGCCRCDCTIGFNSTDEYCDAMRCVRVCVSPHFLSLSLSGCISVYHKAGVFCTQRYSHWVSTHTKNIQYIHR